jgi:hypothetical protein
LSLCDAVGFLLSDRIHWRITGEEYRQSGKGISILKINFGIWTCISAIIIIMKIYSTFFLFMARIKIFHDLSLISFDGIANNIQAV